MSFVEIKCKNCGAILSINNNRKIYVCDFCGTNFIIDNQLFNNHNNSNNDSDFQIRAGVLEKYNGSSANVIIPDNITYIGEQAFKNCIGLTTIKLHSHIISINDNAFENCKNIKTITIPESVITIGRQAFFGCDNLSKIIYYKPYDINSFIGSKYYKEIQKKNLRCQYCGGEFMGIFKKACQKCGKWKDY